jgi:hypothetical protein
MFFVPRLIFDSIDGVRSRFHVLRSGTRFRLYRMGSHFNVLRSRTRFRRYRGRQVSFSCLAHPDPFLAVPTTLGTVFRFCAPGLIFDGTEGVVSSFHVLRSRTRFRRYRQRRVQFLCFALPDSFSAVPRASCLVFMFCAPGPVFGGTDGVRSSFHVLRSRTHFRQYRWRRVPFSCFALLELFSAVSTALGPVFMYYAPRPVFGYTEGMGSHFNVLRSRTRFRRYRGRRI